MTQSKLEKCIDVIPFAVPDGTLIRPRYAREFRYWISDELPPPGTWSLLRALHPRSGLWPVFFHGAEEKPTHPWVDGEVGQPSLHPAQEYNAESILAELWAEYTDPLTGWSPDQIRRFDAITSPFGQVWPGPAPGIEPPASPDLVAEGLAERLIHHGDTRLGLVPVAQGADVLAFTGWPGSRDAELEPGALSAVLRDWELRFGTRLIRVGFNSLVLSVAAPPSTHSAALHVAAEHFAFCRDNVSWAEGALATYAEELIGVPQWSFWWDPVTMYGSDYDEDF